MSNMNRHRTIFLNGPDDLDWLRTTKLKDANPPQFGSFVLFGNEDAPVRLELYADVNPAYNHQPIAAYNMDQESGGLVKEVQPA